MKKNDRQKLAVLKIEELEKKLMEERQGFLKLKMEKETFGICEVCGKEIEEDRLLANPSARTCKKHLNE